MLKPCIPLCKLLIFGQTFRAIFLRGNTKVVDIFLLQHFELPSFAAVFICGIFLSEDILGEAKTNSSRSLSHRAMILLGCLLSFPSALSVFHVPHLFLEVWHPECWPEGSSLIHGILAREISWIIQMLVGVLLGHTPSLPDVLLLWIFLLFNFSL